MITNINFFLHLVPHSEVTPLQVQVFSVTWGKIVHFRLLSSDSPMDTIFVYLPHCAQLAFVRPMLGI